MPMCSTGSLGMVSAPQGGCSSISAAVCGSAQASSLCSMSIAAGKSAPHAMTEFYGYGTTTTTTTTTAAVSPVYLTNLVYEITTNDGCSIDRIDGIGSGACLCLCACWRLTKTAAKGIAVARIWCNSTNICTRTITGSLSCNISGYWTAFEVKGSDVVCFDNSVSDISSQGCILTATEYIVSVVQIIGGPFCVGTPSSASASNGVF